MLGGCLVGACPFLGRCLESALRVLDGYFVGAWRVCCACLAGATPLTVLTVFRPSSLRSSLLEWEVSEKGYRANCRWHEHVGRLVLRLGAASSNASACSTQVANLRSSHTWCFHVLLRLHGACFPAHFPTHFATRPHTHSHTLSHTICHTRLTHVPTHVLNTSITHPNTRPTHWPTLQLPPYFRVVGFGLTRVFSLATFVVVLF